MTELLDLLTIAEEPAVVEPAAQTAIADPAKVDLQAVALAHFGDWRGDVATARRELSTLALDLTIPARIAEAKTLRQRLIKAPVAEVRAVSKALKSRLTAVSKAVGAEEDAAVAAYTDVEQLITPQIEAAEQRIEAERAERARIEAERIAGLKAAADAIMAGWLARCDEPGMTAERIKKGIVALGQVPVPDDLQEVAGYFAEAQGRAIVQMTERKLQMAQREEEARLAAQREEQRRQAEELARQRAELERQAAALRAEQERIERQQQAAHDAEMAALRAKALAEEQPAAAGPAAGEQEPAAIEQPTLTLGQINARLEPVRITGEGLCALGFQPAGRQRAAVLYRESDWAAMKVALVNHINQLA